MQKRMVSMTTHVLLSNWDEPTKSRTSQLLLNLDY